MKKKTNTAKRRFTLVELLVSLGVLVIILGFILQFFIGSQRLWQSMEQRNSLYADARVAMDVMTTMLQNSFYSEGGIPFRIDRHEDYRHKIYFATQSTQNLPGGRLKYVSFQLGNGENPGTGEEDELKIAVFCDDKEESESESEFQKYFPPYGLEPIKTLDDALEGVVNKLDSQLKNTTKDPDTDEPYGSILARGVTSFEIFPYKFDEGSGTFSFSSSPANYDELPFLVEIKLTMLSPTDFKIWKAMSGTDNGNPGKIDNSDNDRVKFRKNHAYTFSRTVFIGEQSRTNINEE